MFSLIVCKTRNGYISASDNHLPEYLPEDLKQFKKTTKGHIIIMGRKTWDSLPKKPLPCRQNVVISSKPIENVQTFSSPLDCVRYFSKHKPKNQKLFVIGGQMIYDWFMKHNMVNEVYETIYEKDIENGDKRFDWCFKHWSADQPIYLSEKLTMTRYVYNNTEENNFLNVLENILINGYERVDRTGVGTKSLFGFQLTFSLENNNFPLLTSRSMNLRMIFEELMWFLRGQTDSKILEEKKVFIWKDNTTREFLDSRGLQKFEQGDIGASYGHQYRHFGAEYVNCQTDYSGKGFDQVENVIHLLKNDKNSRRIMIDLWNSAQLNDMSLPPCLFGMQFYVTPDGGLICKGMQRSSDISLAGGWNIATLSLMTYLLAYVCDLYPKQVIWSTGDTHIYLNQLETVKEQLNVERVPKQFPKMFIKSSARGKSLYDFSFDDLELLNYNPHSRIKIQMNA